MANKDERRKLVIINGVTGALGNAVLARFAQEENTVFYGLSRQGVGLIKVIDNNGKLPLKSMILTIGGDISDKEACKKLVKAINNNKFDEIIYVHAVGLYPFEVDENMNYVVKNDNDKDGINDEVMRLTNLAFRNMTSALSERFDIPVKALIFGGLSDIHKPKAHYSWCKVIEKTKEYIAKTVDKKENFSAIVLNISSVICAHELITRPYVFTRTDAKAHFWLTPQDVAAKVFSLIDSVVENEFIETDLYKPLPNFDSHQYYSDKLFTPRKVVERYGTKSNKK